MDQAALLEILAGKRNASVLAAILQNPKELREAYEDAMNAEGSALKENEKYLDSIQGKIDQFNNAVQALWSDTLDSDVIKFFVELATQLVKIIDAVGPLNIALVGLFAYLEKQHGIFSNLFKPAGEGLEELKRQLAEAERDLKKAQDKDLRKGTNKTAEQRRNAEERVNILKQKVQEASEEAVLDGIDESFDPAKAKRSLSAKKANRTKRINKLQAEGKTFDEIQTDPKVQQYTKEITEAEQALKNYDLAVQQSNASVQQASAITQTNTAVNRANTASSNASAVAETRDTVATQANTDADILATMASDGKVASTWADVWATLISKDATLADVGAKIKQLLITKLLNTEYVKQAILNGQLTVAQMANMTMTQLLGLGFKGLAQSIGQATAKMWAFMTTTPIGWILLAVAAVVALGAAFAAVHKTSAELKEELDGLKSELQGIQSELDSVNQELETTQERMSELLAMPSLSFTEQKELENLKEQNEELERQARLLEAQEKRKRKEMSEKAAKTFDKQMKESGVNFWGKTGTAFAGSILGTALGPFGNLIGGIAGTTIANLPTEVKLNAGIGINGALTETKDMLEEKLNSLDDEKYEKVLPFMEPLINGVGKIIQDNSEYVDSTLAAMKETLDGVEYGYGADEQLDKYYNLAYKREIAAGTIGAESDGLAHIFSRPEHKAAKEGIDKYVQLLKDGNENAKAEIENIISNNAALVADIKAMGLDITDAVDYFVLDSAGFNSDTVDGIAAQYAKGIEVMKKFQSENQSDWGDAFFKKDKDGKFQARAHEFGEVLTGMDNKARETFMNIAESVKNGEISWEQAMSKFTISGLDRQFELLNNEFETLNNEMFAGAADDINGLIDTVSELQAALEDVASTMDLVHTAQTQMNSSGRISVKTALELMQTTEDWDSILEITNGTIKLRDGAEQHLIQTELTAIKTQLHYAWTTAQTRYETALAAQGELDYANNSGVVMTAESIKAEAIGRVSAVIVALGAAMDEITSGNWGSAFSAFGDTYTKATATVVQDAQQYATDIATLKKNAEDSKKMYDAASQITGSVSDFKDYYDYDETPGDKYDDDDEKKAADDAFQAEMDYWENRIQANQARADRLQGQIDLLEQKGMKAGAQYYRDQIKLLASVDGTDGIDSKLELLHQKLGSVNARLEDTVEGSEEWWEAAHEYNDIVNEIQEIESAIVDMQDAIAEIDTYKFEEFNERLDDITSKLGTIRNLIASDEEDWFDDEGNWTDDGIAVLGTYVQELETYKQGYDEVQGYLDDLSKYEYNEANAKLLADKFGIHSEQEYYDRMEELMDQQYDYAESINDTEESIVDMYESSIDAVEEYFDTLIDGYNDYINSVKEALDAERDLFEFKKNVQKQAKDISELERRIASLSGSTNKSDIAERRKLEAQLYESRESLNDTYYDHAKDAQQDALDQEAEAYEETMTKMVEGMRTSLEEATANMETFLDSVTIAVSMNADIVLEKYRETEVPLNDSLTNPWEEAAEKAKQYGKDANNLMDVWKKDGYFAEFCYEAGINLSDPWSSGTSAANAFKTSVDTVMDDVVEKIETNVQSAATKLSNLYQQIIDTENRAKAAEIDVGDLGGGGSGGYSGGSSLGGSTASEAVRTLQMILEQVYNKQVPVNGIWDTQTSNALKSVQKTIGVSQTGKYDESTARALESNIKNRSLYSSKMGMDSDAEWYKKYYKMVPSAFHAKGTLSTTRDEWAITDESWIGEEITLAAGKNGQLQYLKKGSAVMPANISANLVEWGKINPNMLNVEATPNVNMISNAVNKPEFNFEFDALVKAENITEETLPAVKKFVTQELNRFTKELNYALKGKGAR